MRASRNGPSARGDNRLVVAMPYDAQLFNEVYRNYTGGGGYCVANNMFNRLVVRVFLTDHSAHLGYRTEWGGWSWEPPVRGTLPFWCHERVRPRQPG